jgi:hypothetical protein
MSKNTKNEFYKKYLKLIERRSEIWDAQRNLGYVELETPIHHGYISFYVLRDDISRRKDGEILANLLNKYSHHVWSRTKDFIEKNGKRKYVKTPSLTLLQEREYEKLTPKIQEYFRVTWEKYWDGYRKCYILDFPSYYLVIKKKKDYITHRKVIDGTLEAEEAFIRDQIYLISYQLDIYNTSSMKPYSKAKNKSNRRADNIVLKRIVTSFEYLDFYDTIHDEGLSLRARNSAKWDRW